MIKGKTIATESAQVRRIVILVGFLFSFRRASIGRNNALSLSTEIIVNVIPDTNKLIPAIRSIVTIYKESFQGFRSGVWGISVSCPAQEIPKKWYQRQIRL